MNITGYFKQVIRDAVMGKFGVDIGGDALKVEKPPEEQPGDYGTNAGFIAAKLLKKNPLEIADAVSGAVGASPYVNDVIVVNPGYLNWSIKPDCYKQELKSMLADEGYFHNDTGAGKKINIEFVSANPTGPLNVVSGRAAAYGDTLANLLTCCGYSVTREFYVNDFGNQLNLFAEAVLARYAELFVWNKPASIIEEEHKIEYKGEYVKQLGRDLKAQYGDKFLNSNETERIKEISLSRMISSQKETLKDFGVEFDKWFRESLLHEKGKNNLSEVEQVYGELDNKGILEEREGAVWFKTMSYGDDKDRVVKKSDGNYTYFMSDIAYMKNKITRGADLIINILGPDHHGYISRLEAIIQALGYKKERLQVIILQQVNLIEDGEKMKMSKRAGKLVTLDELLLSVGKDAARYYFIMRNYNSHLDFDVALAKEKSEKNPVYYVQYAYARVCNIFVHAKENGYPVEENEAEKGSDFSMLEKEEAGLIRGMIGIQEAVRDAALKQSPSVFVQAVYELVSDFHSFYNKHRVVTEDRPVTLKRLFIMLALKKTLAKCFKIIGIKAMEKM
jgi:arginyl-tRNA synthetase